MHPKLTPQNGRASPGSRQHAHVHVGDGFVGSELETVPSRKPRRRGKITPRISRSNVEVAGLRLASGSLPIPTIHYADPSTAEPLDAIPGNLHVESRITTKIATRPEITKLHVAARDTQAQYQRAERVERAVESQLSRITAPDRRDSQSSGSQTSIEQQSIIDDQEYSSTDHLENTPTPESSMLVSEASCH
jgi:hypothetical protein